MTSNLNRVESILDRMGCSARMKAAGLFVAASVLSLALVATPALAREGLGVTGRFGQPGSAPGQLLLATIGVEDTGGSSLAVSSTHDIYVADTGNKRVEWFNSAGDFQGQFNGIEVDGHLLPAAERAPAYLSRPEFIAVDNDPESPSFGDVYVAETGTSLVNGVIDKFTSSGEFLYQFSRGNIGGIAVDPSGDMWVLILTVSREGAFAQKFGNELENAPMGGLVQLGGDGGEFAVDSEDNLYRPYGALDKFSETGMLLGQVCANSCARGGLAIEPGTNDLFTDDRTSIAEYGPFGEPFEAPIRTSKPILNQSTGIAVDPTSHVVYVADSGSNQILSFGLGIQPEKPEALPPEEVQGTSAIFRGKLANPHKEKLEYHFVYNVGHSCAGGRETESKTLSSTEAEKAEVPVAIQATKLEASAESTYCLVAENNFGPAEPAQLATPFTTPAAPPELLGGSASSVGDVEVELTAVINPENEETTYTFEYSSEGSTTENKLKGSVQTVPEEPFPTLPGEFRGVSVAAVVFLIPNRTIYYRVVATNKNGGTATGDVQAYTKLPLVENESFSALTSTSVRLEAAVNPVFVTETRYEFEYATEEAKLGTSEATVVGKGELPPESVSMQFPVSAEIASLQPGKTYYYRAVARNSSSEYLENANKGRPIDGPIASFKPFAAPAVTTGEAQNIARTSATLSGTVDPEGAETTYSFQYISETAYRAALANGAADPYTEGETTVPVSAGSGNTAVAVGPTQAPGLRPGETYHYRLVATNSFGVQGVGADATFTATSATPPSVSTGGASGVSQNTATLSGTVTTNGLQTNYGFEIGTEPGNYGPATGLGAIGGSLTEEVHVTLGELQPGTTYYYRVSATNADGAVRGEPGSFATPGFPTLLVPTASLPLIPNPSVVFPAEEPGSGTSTGTLTDKQKLARALRACHAKRGKRRASCEAAAHRKYGGSRRVKRGKKK